MFYVLSTLGTILWMIVNCTKGWHICALTKAFMTIFVCQNNTSTDLYKYIKVSNTTSVWKSFTYKRHKQMAKKASIMFHQLVPRNFTTYSRTVMLNQCWVGNHGSRKYLLGIGPVRQKHCVKKVHRKSHQHKTLVKSTHLLLRRRRRRRWTQTRKSIHL